MVDGDSEPDGLLLPAVVERSLIEEGIGIFFHPNKKPAHGGLEVFMDEHLLKALQFSAVFIGVQLLVKLEDWLTFLAKKYLPKGSKIRKFVLINPDED
jgi:hypothetical protein